MERRRVELQIRAVLVVYRAQRRTAGGEVLEATRQRSREILDSLDAEVSGDRELELKLEEARRELDDSSP